MFVPNIKRPAKPSHFLFTATQNDAIKKSETTPPQTAGKRDRINLAVTNFFIRSPARHRRLTTTRRTGRDYEIFYHALNSLSRQKNPYFSLENHLFHSPIRASFNPHVHSIRMGIQMLHISKNSDQRGCFFESLWRIGHNTGSFYKIINSKR